MRKTIYFFSFLVTAFMVTASVQAQTPDPDFHIYLAFGQSNMEGQNWSGSTITYSDQIPLQHKQNVDPRFRVMAAVGGSYKLASGTEQRVSGQWYTAVPPLVRSSLGLCPADYFGRTIVAATPENIKVGVIAVAVAGAAIEGFEKGDGANTYFSTQQSWMQTTAAQYNNNPYNHLVTLAKEAQKVGVIKGIIMHQGESGAQSGNWATKVKGIYDNILNDLGLPANSIPFLAGQAYGTGNNNNTINGLTNAWTANIAGTTKRVAHVVSSSGCASGGDNLHFSYDGYKVLGEHYGQKMLELLSTPDGTENLVQNGTFTGITTITNSSSPWKFYTYGGSAGSASVSGGKATLTITTAGADTYAPQLIQQGISLEQGRKYRLTWTASAAEARTMEVLLQKSSDPYTPYSTNVADGGDAGIRNLTTTEQNFTLEFKMNEPSDANTQLSFNVGGDQTQSVTISNVKLIVRADAGISDIATDEFKIRPTVLGNVVNVNFTAAGNETELRLYDLIGNLITSEQLQTIASGSYSEFLNHGKLSSGVYIVWMRSGAIVKQAKVIVK